jgi:thiol-disulfide isomerase/thioredoxin
MKRWTSWSFVVVFAGLTSTSSLEARGTRTEQLDAVGGKRRCERARGLAGWRTGEQGLWSLERTLRPQQPTASAPRTVVISFFATWCEGCREGLPVIQRVARSARTLDTEVVLVAVPPYSTPVERFLSDTEVELPTIVDEFGGIWKRWNSTSPSGTGTASLPLTVVINREQQLSAIFGEEGDDFEQVLSQAIGAANEACSTVAQL